MVAPLASLGVLSIGEMGLGVSKLLVANNYRVLTNITASLELVSTDEELVNKSDYILSIVPPRDALATAKRILDVAQLPSFAKRSSPLYYLDLNAISPRSAREIGELFSTVSEQIRFIDGGIIGPAPRLKDTSGASDSAEAWARPSIPVSGPYLLSDATPNGAHLAKLLNTKQVSGEIGGASGLKMCFASLTKGMTALAIQSFTTAHRLNVLPELQEHLEQYSPRTKALASGGMVGMPPKAYRWVNEMEQIAQTLCEDGGFDETEAIFPGVARTYDLVAYGTELGEEKTESRVQGKTAEDCARLMSEGIDRRQAKIKKG